MGRIIGLVLLCFLVGVVLAFFGTTPATIFTDLWRAAVDAWGVVVDVLTWAMPYILLGAVVVVPIAVIAWVLRLAKRS